MRTCKDCFNCMECGGLTKPFLKCSSLEHEENMDRDGENAAVYCRGFDPILIPIKKIVKEIPKMENNFYTLFKGKTVWIVYTDKSNDQLVVIDTYPLGVVGHYKDSDFLVFAPWTAIRTIEEIEQ